MTAPEKTSTGELIQWASRVIKFSSEYDTLGWSASSVLGQPRVYPRYGDNSGAWAQEGCGNDEYLELGYTTPVYVSAINIYETWNCGGVRRVSVQNPQGGWDTVWETQKVQFIKESRIFSPDIKPTSYKSKGVRLDVDCSVSNSWVEIDAVQLVGRKLKVSPPLLSSVLDDYARLVNDAETGDVVLHAADGDVHAHSAILSVRSRTFKQWLADQKQGKGVQVEDIDFNTLLGVLYFIYSGNIPNTFSTASLVDVWRAGKKLQSDGLQNYCVSRVDERMSTDDVIKIFTKSSETHPVADDIREVCLEYIASNLASVSLTEDFKKLSQPLMLEIVQQCASKMSVH